MIDEVFCSPSGTQCIFISPLHRRCGACQFQDRNVCVRKPFVPFHQKAPKRFLLFSLSVFFDVFPLVSVHCGFISRPALVFGMCRLCLQRPEWVSLSSRFLTSGFIQRTRIFPRHHMSNEVQLSPVTETSNSHNCGSLCSPEVLLLFSFFIFIFSRESTDSSPLLQVYPG